PAEIAELHEYGICRIYSPDDGRAMGLEGMIGDVINRCGVLTDPGSPFWNAVSKWNGRPPLNEKNDIRKIARAITIAESGQQDRIQPLQTLDKSNSAVLGITGTGGSGKSSVTDEIVRRLLQSSETVTCAVVSVDPSKKKTGGALLGDRIRMNAISNPRVYMRSLATRDDNTALSAHVKDALDICRNAGYDLVILESAGTGQSDTSILDLCDVSL